MFLWSDSVSDISMTVDPFLFLFCDLLLPVLWLGSWTRVSIHSWSRSGSGSLKASPRSAQTCYIWHFVFIGARPRSAYSFTPSSHLPFPLHPPPTSLLHFLPPPSHSFLPLFAFAPLIHFQCQLLPFLCQITLPHSLYCVCLTAKERLWRLKWGRENKGGGGA